MRDDYERNRAFWANERATLTAKLQEAEQERDQLRSQHPPPVPTPTPEVAGLLRLLLSSERVALQEYHYDVYGKDDLTERLNLIDEGLRWLQQLASPVPTPVDAIRTLLKFGPGADRLRKWSNEASDTYFAAYVEIEAWLQQLAPTAQE